MNMFGHVWKGQFKRTFYIYFSLSSESEIECCRGYVYQYLSKYLCFNYLLNYILVYLHC